MPDPDLNALTEIAKAHFGEAFLDQNKKQIDYLIENFRSGSRSTDQLLNAIYLLTQEVGEDEESIKNLLLRRLNIVD